MGVCDRENNSNRFDTHCKQLAKHKSSPVTVLGPLLIYRVPGSVAFLSSGSTLRPILEKSQCWCVDGESKFVIPIGDQSYYRIELPNGPPKDNAMITEFKGVLEKILKYEKTPCPFKRGFTVDLPEPPKTPVRKRPWKPTERPPTESTSPRTRTDWAHTRETMVEQDIQDFESLGTCSNSVTVKQDLGNICMRSEDVNREGAARSNIINKNVDEKGLGLHNSMRAGHNRVHNFETLTRATKNGGGRAVTVPHNLTFQTDQSPKTSVTMPVLSKRQSKLRNGSPSLSSSVESFHSFHSPISPLPPSPPYSNPASPSPKLENDCGLVVSRTRSRKHDVPEPVLTNEPGTWDFSGCTATEDVDPSTPTIPDTPTLVSDDASQSEDTWPDSETPSPLTELRQRRALSRRPTQSPLPSPANAYSPSCGLPGHHLTTAILQKTCSILLGPPVQLVALMLNIASKIAKGTFRGAAYGYGEPGQRIPCSWNFSDSDDDTDPTWEEDDYGISLGNGTGGTRRETTNVHGGSWEID
jgi:hypothetical protein